MEKKKVIHAWLPDTAFKGGIQAFSRDFLKALNQSAPDAQKIVLIKNDLPGGLWQIRGFEYRCFGRWPKPLRTLFFALGLLRTAFFHRPQLIIVGHANFAIVASFLNWLLGIPYWVIIYGIEVWDENGARVASALHSADRLLAISRFTRDKVIEQQGIDPEQFTLLPTTFDETRFLPGPRPEALMDRLNLMREKQIILTVSRLAGEERYKGYDQILKAMPAILRAVPNAHYILVGKGEDKDRIRQLIAELGIEEHVTLAGYVPVRELVDYYNLSHVFAMPSKKEGFGIVFLEALACGKPVVAGNQDGSVDALCDGKLGVLINPDDVDEIAGALIEILQRRYPLPIIYSPDALREKVLEIYGFNRFTQTLKENLDDFFGLLDDRADYASEQSRRLSSPAPPPGTR